jgi:DNA-binding NarL/FixJ family response regulator
MLVEINSKPAMREASNFKVSRQNFEMPITVAIVEDDNGVRESLAALIKGTPGFQCLNKFPNAELALKELPRNWPDVVIMDINLPRQSGIECVAKLKALKPKLQILIFTVFEDSNEVFKALMAGASGYLMKDTPPAEILDAINEVHRGGSPMSGLIARKVVDYFQSKGKTSEDVGSLSARELEVLTYLAKGFRYKEIGDVLSISSLTVRSHLQKIYEKLHVRSRTEAVVKFLGRN